MEIFCYSSYICRKYLCHPISVICTCSLITLCLLAVAGTMVLLSFYAQGDLNSMETEGVVFGPGDTQTLFFSPLFCEHLSPYPDTLYSSDFESSSLYLLDKEPLLTGVDNVTFTDEFVIFDRSKLRAFHFYSDTVIAFDVCLNNITYSGSGTFYLIKGKAAYEEWADSGETDPPDFTATLQVREVCSASKQSFDYTVSGEDQYYLVFVDDKHLSPYPTEIMVEYRIRRRTYGFNQSSVLSSCQFTTSPCSIRVPLCTSAAALLVYGTPVDWESDWENRAISVQCSPRIWLYTLVTGLGALVIAFVTICLCTLCCCCGRCFLQEVDESSKPLLGQHTADLYSRRSSSSEMTDPSRDNGHAPSASSTPHIIFRSLNNPYTPPSFKRSDKFSLGTPTCETFAGSNQ